MTSRGSGVVPRRRNGKQQACEPCRKAKIACDHTLPVCDRCRRRKATEKCVYLTAPMTRRSPPTSKDLNYSPLATPISNISSDIPTNESLQSPESRPPIEPGRIQSGGFFGPTNFSAVFVENSENIGNDIQLSNDSDTLPSYDTLQSQNFLMLPTNEFRGSPRIALGVRILRQLPDQKTCKFLTQWFSERICSTAPPQQALQSMINSMWSMWENELREPRHPEDIERVSAHLCKNSESPLQEVEDYYPWLASITGPNMRWEVIGLVFSSLCHAVLTLSERDVFFTTQKGQRRDRRHFALELKDCVQACVTLSNYMDYINIVMVSLLAKNMVLTTVISGDTSLVVWRQLGDLVSTTTALGLHRQVDNGGSITFLSEMKKRVFTIVFNIDKASSHLTGRPPALSYRYTRFRIPLDIEDDALLQGPEEIKKAVEMLDANGWNSHGQFHPSTYTRAHGFLSIVSNELLEVSLGDPSECTSERITSLLNRLQQTYNSFPPFLHYSPSDANSPSVTDNMLFRRLCLHLTFLEHRLTLERLAHKVQILNGQSMIDCALEMLQLTVLLWVQRDRFLEHHHDYDWMLMCWGIPSSGVLCVEVLKQMKTPNAFQGLKIPKSEIVQNLSLLVGFLEWVKPGAGNYLLCGRMSRLVKRILDQILNYNPIVQQENREQRYEENGFRGDVVGGVVGMEMDSLGGGDFGAFGDLDWLNELDWSRGPWMNLDGLT